MSKARIKLFLFLIVGFAFFVRIWQVASIPPSLSWDEVSIGYNAYSILKTGRDEYGRVLPLDTFVAYGDYKPPLSVYATVPFVAVFGLNELAVRLPSVIAGTLTVLATYFLVLELFSVSLFTFHLSLITALLLAISPWHIQLSRAGFEANIALFFVVMGTYLLLRARKNSKLFAIAFLPFIAAGYTFNSARYFSPLLIFGLLAFCRKEALQQKRIVILGFIVAILALLPIMPHLVSKEARLRFAEVNIFTDASIVATANRRMEQEGNSFISKVFDNRRIGFVRLYLAHFLDHMQPWFLFVKGDGNPKFSIQDVGQLYPIEAPLLVLGIFWLFGRERSIAWLLLWWIIAAIVPAAVARETPHALRIENSLPVWQVFIAYALLHVRKKILMVLVIGAYVFSFSYFWHNYFNHYPAEYSGEWQYGYREAIRFIQPIKGNYQSIVLTESIGRPYMYVLFYELYDPNAARRDIKGNFDAAGFYNVTGLGKYRFVREGAGDLQKQTLYILPPAQVPGSAHILQTIPLLNGQPQLVIFDV
ncbi:glycosyltransferase family 39 protein [Candidatus Gottesmanbacteria bacterium]|nr:glycosyltransferase family 39 protein [Candidatus Gottesmanbacteria bacterium]